MITFRYMTALTYVLTMVLVIGCSGGKTPVTPDNEAGLLDTVPIINLTEAGGVLNAAGLLGAFELSINSDEMTAELVNKRVGAIGEDYIVSGIGFFTVAPCSDCLWVNSLFLVGGNLVVNFGIKHPFDPGNASQPPSATNRLDLDVFDLAMVVVPGDVTPSDYALTDASIYPNVLVYNQGYTTELAEVIDDSTAVPYTLVVDDSLTALNTFNKFGMGFEATFNVTFDTSVAITVIFDLYLTMGYGFSAKKPDRLIPKYYNPEFNRKSAWRIDVTPPPLWEAGDSTTAHDVEIMVYDWQAGATVSTELDFSDADPSHVFAASEVDTVSVEIPGMNSTLPFVSTPTSGTGAPNDPLIYKVPVANANNLAAGQYVGMVKVTDTRAVLTPLDLRDYLIDAPDGVTMTNYSMPEYAAYQTFTAVVSSGNGWAGTWGSTWMEWGTGIAVDVLGNSYCTGYFFGTVDFDPDGSEVEEQTSNGGRDVYLSKFDPDGNLIWLRTWGGTGWEQGADVCVDDFDNIYVTGYYTSFTDFDPSETGTDFHTPVLAFDAFISKFDPNGNFVWANTWGGGYNDYGFNVDSDALGNTYVAGSFYETVDFDPGPAVAEQTSNGISDAFLVKFDPDGNYMWARIWGGANWEKAFGGCTDDSGNTLAAGYFEDTVDFDTGASLDEHISNGDYDVFITKFDTDGEFLWARTWGGALDDVANEVLIHDSGDIFAVGIFSDIVDFDPSGGTDNHISNGNLDVFLSKFDTNGNFLWAQTWGGINDDIGRGLDCDNYNNIYITGRFSDTIDFDPTTAGIDFHPSNGFDDIFLSKIGTNGSYIWAQTWGGIEYESAWAVATSGDGSSFLTGGFENVVDFDPGGGVDSHASVGWIDVFIMKVLPNGYWN